MKLIDISTPKYPNTFAMVDDEDFDFLNQWKWHPHKSNTQVYARRLHRKSDARPSIGIVMHRQIMGFHGDKVIDHINRNSLDNRRENLRFCTIRQNAQNSKNKNTKLFRGLTWSKKMKRFVARIRVNGKHIDLGGFVNPVDAAKAYNEAAKIHHGEFASLNRLPSADEQGEGK